jgi:hypothetical protein
MTRSPTGRAPPCFNTYNEPQCREGLFESLISKFHPLIRVVALPSSVRKRERKLPYHVLHPNGSYVRAHDLPTRQEPVSIYTALRNNYWETMFLFLASMFLNFIMCFMTHFLVAQLVQTKIICRIQDMQEKAEALADLAYFDMRNYFVDGWKLFYMDLVALVFPLAGVLVGFMWGIVTNAMGCEKYGRMGCR